MNDQVALVTGGSRGIGAATVELLSERGARVAFTWKTGAEPAARLAQATGALSIRADVRDLNAMQEAVARTVATLGALDIVVANAGIWQPATMESMTPGMWSETIDVNLTGTYTICRAAARELLSGDGASLVVVASTAGQRGEAGVSHYAASKGGQISLVKSLAVEWAPAVRVNAVAPGWVDTELNDKAFAGDGRSDIEAGIPLGRVATPRDIAEPIVFLAGNGARHITGEVLNVNGGSVLCG